MALVAMRVAVAGLVITDLVPISNAMLSMWQMAGTGLLFLFIFAGALTPLLCVLCCVLEIASVFYSGEPSALHLVILLLITSAWGVLGPGAYSLDAFLFGRRRIVLPGDRRFDEQ